MSDLLPLFVKLAGRRVVVVGGGPVAASKLAALLAAEAHVTVIAPHIHPDIARAAATSSVSVRQRAFEPSDLDEAWFVVAAATPDVNRAVAAAAEARRVFVNAVDDPANASAFLSGVVRNSGVTIAISSNGDAPGLTALLREALEQLLPEDLSVWMDEARRQRIVWKRDRVPMAERRPLLLQALNRLYQNDPAASDLPPADTSSSTSQPSSSTAGENASQGAAHSGFVSLVGAGPGDPGLLTRAAVARLRAADLVLYDALVDERVLKLAPRARRFFVGKRAGRHALSQSEIDALMVRAAHRGRRVVRLKGGDPFVFGRGGEEVLALQSAGVPFEVIPGVSSVVAAPALAGIPVTHRGVSSALLVVSGHDQQAFARAVAGRSHDEITLVVVMGLARRAALAQELRKHGWPADLPAAVVVEASTPRQDVWRGTLDDLAAGRDGVSTTGPALFVVGRVAAMTLATIGAAVADEQTAATREQAGHR
ncbi:MAG TPA: siroheme synthase CysG [Vicinamibacterales bacterium]|nr:siroheme synthase CysG [Vicinamibacterales bacterium]